MHRTSVYNLQAVNYQDLLQFNAHKVNTMIMANRLVQQHLQEVLILSIVHNQVLALIQEVRLTLNTSQALAHTQAELNASQANSLITEKIDASRQVRQIQHVVSVNIIKMANAFLLKAVEVKDVLQANTLNSRITNNLA